MTWRRFVDRQKPSKHFHTGTITAIEANAKETVRGTTFNSRLVWHRTSLTRKRYAITFSSVMVLFRAEPVCWVDEWLANGADIHAEEMER